MPTAHRLAAVSEIPVGTGKEFVAGDRIVAVFNIDGAFHAMDGLCPHAGGPLAKGMLRGKVVTCPWHGWQFDVTNGHHCLNPNIRHPAISVEVRGDDIVVEIP